ncbi:MAG: hypothetical protein KDD48_06955, partial [Bdellovibrionales bacterium]|nr:hypothetical protein [Bdellovibrionales bacterium]
FSTLRGVPSQVHAVIAGSQHMKKVLRKILPEHVLVETIYHHADPLLKPHQAGEDSLKLAYIGEPESSKFIKGEIKDLNNVSFKDKEINWREEIRNYNAHFSARVDPTKSVIKLSNVSALGAVFLTGPEPGCVELLGDSYPFYLNTPLTQKSVSDDVDYLKSMVGTKLWREARAQIENVKPNLTLDATARAYENLILSQL